MVGSLTALIIPQAPALTRGKVSIWLKFRVRTNRVIEEMEQTYKMPRLRLYSTMFFSRGGTSRKSQLRSLHGLCLVLTLDVLEGPPRQRREDEVTQKAENGRDEIQVHGTIAAHSVRIQPIP